MSKARLVRNGLPLWLPLCILVIVILIDIASKSLVYNNLPLMKWTNQWYPYGGVGVFRNFLGIEFSLVHATNSGAAWGIFSEFPHWLLAFRIGMIVAVAGYALFYNENRRWTIPLTLIVAGATGNVIDFFVYGKVVDMFHFVLWGYDYPVFNVADISIFCGVAGICLDSIFHNSRKKK